MGKSPGKWIKGLFGKKISKSDTSKGRLLSKSASERAGRSSSKDPTATLSVDRQLISGPLSGTITKGCDETLSTTKDEKFDRDGDVLKVPDPCSENNELNKAALTLQAYVRGHLVRRQGVATFYCLQGIVRFQALARGHMVRKNTTGTAQFRGKSSVDKVAKIPDTSEITMHVRVGRLLKNAFVYKLCGSSPSAMPLLLEYDQEEPNSAWNWLVRWSKLQVLAIDSKSKKSRESEHGAAEIESSENVTSDLEKQYIKLDTAKESAESSEENGLFENEKDKHGKKLEKPAQEVSTEAALDVEKPLKPLNKVSESSATSEFPEQNSNLAMDDKLMEEDTQKTASEKDDDVKFGQVGEDVLGKNAVSNLSSEVHPGNLVSEKSTNGNFTEYHKESKVDQAGIPSQKSSRRASLPAKPDGQITTKVPSYMATTASSKAKAKALASPRPGLDRNSLDRRLSLPSSVNVRMSSSPRVQKLVQGNRKEGVKLDRSLSSSRDAKGNKVTQVDWKR